MRAAARLVQLGWQFYSRILVRFGSQVADARSIVSIMILVASLGSPLDIKDFGDDKYEAIQAVTACIEDQL